MQTSAAHEIEPIRMPVSRMYHQFSYSDFKQALIDDAVLSEFEKVKRNIRDAKQDMSIADRIKEKHDIRLENGGITQKNYDNFFSIVLSNLKQDGNMADLSYVLSGMPSTYKGLGALVMLGFDVPEYIAEEGLKVQVPKIALEHMVSMWVQPVIEPLVLKDLVQLKQGKYCDVPVYAFPESR